MSTTGFTAALATLAEKAVWTFVQAFLAVLAVNERYDFDADTARAAAIAAIPAVLTLALNAINQAGSPLGLPFALDLLYRVVRTYAVSFIGFLVAVPVFSLDLSLAVAANAAALPAVFALIKGVAASRLGAKSAATLPMTLDSTVTPAC